MTRGRNTEVGYGKPPKHSRFKKGQSGNPRGRPRRQVEIISPDPLLPIEAAIRREAARLVTVREGDKRVSISTIDGILRALGHSAMKGGVLAQRDFIGLYREIEKREFERKKYVFQKALKYVESAGNCITAAKARGQPEPELIPHPDDIEFDYGNFDIRIAGPLNEEEAANALHAQRLSRLCVEMSLYHQEDARWEEGPLANAEVGYWLMSHVALELNLPKRMRITPDYHCEADRRRVRHRVWEAWMRGECKELNIPFIKATKPGATFKLGELGVKLPANFYQERPLHDLERLFCDRAR